MDKTDKKAFRIPQWLKTAWPYIRPVLVLSISLAVSFVVFSNVYKYIQIRYMRPVDIDDPTPYMLVVENSDSASRIASKLYEACGEGESGIISNKAVFKVYVDFVGKANKLKAGTYILSKNMDIPQIVDIICAGNPPKPTVKFTVQEGFTISGVLWALDKAGIKIDEEAFRSLCNETAMFSKYSFVEQLTNRPDKERDYALEGYLFPDTYEVFIDVRPEAVINKMLMRFYEIFTDEYIARAKELNLSIDDVVTLASIIEREASVDEDFYKVSAVFHNRLADGQKLESCATMQYALKVNKYVYTEQERATQSPYNTYLYEGLPAGPVSNPGKRAIEAALYPNQEYLNKKYKYFCNMDLPENKSLVFAKTFEEHQANVERYSKFW